MRVAHRAWELRGAARLALRAGDRAAGAVALANAARRLHRTPRGERLLALALIATGQVAQARAIIEDAIGHDAGTTRQPVEAPSPEPADAAESPDQPDQSP